MSDKAELLELTRIRILLFIREPEAVFWVLAFPLVLAAVLGYAFRDKGVAPSPVGVLESARGEAWYRLLEEAPEIELEHFEDSESAERQLFKGDVDAFVESGEPLELLYDAQRDQAEMAVLRIHRELARERLGEAELVSLETFEEKGSRYIDFLFPGLLGMNIMGTGMWGIGFGIADVRRRRFLKRMIVTPMRHSSFFLSFILSRLVFLVVEVLILTLFAIWVLDVPFRCGVLGYGTLCMVSAFTFAGLGLLIASRVRTIEGVNGLLNLAMMPMWLGSGVFFSYERFPEAIHPVLKALPLTGLNDALRALMLEGASLGSQLPELLIQVAWAAGTFLLALKIFRWE